MSRWGLKLLIIGVVLASVLATAGLLVVYNAQQDRQRALLVCEQVSELREDVVTYLKSRNFPAQDFDEFRPVRCPS